jgi:protein TonB
MKPWYLLLLLPGTTSPDLVCAQAKSGLVVPTTVIEYYDANDIKLASSDNFHHKAEIVYSDSVGGTETMFYSTGKPHYSTAYSNVRSLLKNGESLSWYENGKLHTKENYVADKRQGELTVYYPTGKLKRRDFYVQDKLTKGQCFGADGKPVKHTDYERYPTYPGGPEALLGDISRNIEYPQDALINKLEGQVLVNFEVGRDGRTKNVTVAKGLSPTTDAAAVRAIQELKQFTPSTRDGELVVVRYRVPVNFAIQ